MKLVMVLIMISTAARAQKIPNETLRQFGAGALIGYTVAQLTNKTDDRRVLTAVGVTIATSTAYTLLSGKPSLSLVINTGMTSTLGAFVANQIRRRQSCKL